MTTRTKVGGCFPVLRVHLREFCVLLPSHGHRGLLLLPVVHQRHLLIHQGKEEVVYHRGLKFVSCSTPRRCCVGSLASLQARRSTSWSLSFSSCLPRPRVLALEGSPPCSFVVLTFLLTRSFFVLTLSTRGWSLLHEQSVPPLPTQSFAIPRSGVHVSALCLSHSLVTCVALGAIFVFSSGH